MVGQFRLDLDASAIEDLGFSDEARDLAQGIGDDIAADAAARAPRDSGDGARSIHAQVDADSEGAYADVSWDADHFYMGFKELGTEHEPPSPFLRPALDNARL